MIKMTICLEHGDEYLIICYHYVRCSLDKWSHIADNQTTERANWFHLNENSCYWQTSYNAVGYPPSPFQFRDNFFAEEGFTDFGITPSLKPVLTGHPKGMQQFIGPQRPLVFPLIFRLPAREASPSIVSWPFVRLHDLIFSLSLYFWIWNKTIFSTKRKKIAQSTISPLKEIYWTSCLVGLHFFSILVLKILRGS